MKNVIFIGAGGFASECYYYLLQNRDYGTKLYFKGFLSPQNKLSSYGLSDLYLGDYCNYKFNDNDYVVIAIGDPCIRKKIYEYVKKNKIKLFTLIAPTSVVNNPQNIGEGCVIANFCVIASNAKIGVCNVINTLSSVGHDVEIGDFNVLSSHSDICGNTKIGNLNFFGSRCSTLPNSFVGNFNKISSGSVVYKKIRNNCVVKGNPAVKVCDIEELEIEKKNY